MTRPREKKRREKGMWCKGKIQKRSCVSGLVVCALIVAEFWLSCNNHVIVVFQDVFLYSTMSKNNYNVPFKVSGFEADRQRVRIHRWIQRKSKHKFHRGNHKTRNVNMKPKTDSPPAVPPGNHERASAKIEVRAGLPHAKRCSMLRVRTHSPATHEIL